MMIPFNPDLMKHPAAAHTAPTAHEREVLRSRREARRVAFFAFVEEVFARAPRHPAPVVRARTNSAS